MWPSWGFECRGEDRPDSENHRLTHWAGGGRGSCMGARPGSGSGLGVGGQGGFLEEVIWTGEGPGCEVGTEF